MVTHRVGFNPDDVNKAYQMYENREDNIVKVVMNVGS
jgi:threonine dehydrogenase-like Zn-dependent dehydrogenase